LIVLIAQSSGQTSVRRPESQSITAALVRLLSPQPQFGRLEIETPWGERINLEGTQPGGTARLSVHRWRFIGRLLTSSDIGFADAYAAGDLSSPDLDTFLCWALQNAIVKTSLAAFGNLRPLLKLRHALNRNTRRGSRRNNLAHYDLGNDFYAKWLDAGMNYSAALFSLQDQTLEQAQDAKLDRVCSLLEPSRGQQVLEIGCGWGALAERLADRHECSVTGITLSTRQLDFARSRLANLGAAPKSEIRLQDYRDVGGSYDRVVSIEMLEAVGEAYWPAYFSQLRARLRPGGIAVLQAITIDENRFDTYRRRPDFIQKYIFPGGMLPTKTIIEREANAVGLRLTDSEFFGASYARTIKAWQERFQASWPNIRSLGFNERFYRTWNYYLAYCRVGFESGPLDVGLYKLERPRL
jgi:cyclopropane-fatty-acyl-phospholipid synthase